MDERAERWRQVSELFDRVADLAPAQRERILSLECADDPALRAEVERLLQADGLTNPLDHDIAAQASKLLLEGDPEQHRGQLFGPYRIERLLGQGGMGRVYLARREGDDFTQTVALKLVGGVGGLNAELARRRFVEERRLLARLEHPNIARLLDGGVGPEAQPWFAMEYVDGAPLTEVADAQRLGVAARLALFAKLCDAVDYAHRFLIVHRDLKPGNLLVDTRGEPKVLDFGIAKLLNEDGQHAGEASTILMTPDYAAPEQIRGGQISTATDVYSLGAVLFELLTGRRPFKDALASREPPIASKVVIDDKGALTQRASACATTPQALRKALRGDLDRIVRTALDPEPARRYGSAAALAQDLRAVVAGQPISLRSDRAYRAGLFLRRHRLSAAAVTIAALGLVATTGWALWQTGQTAERAREAIRQADLARQEALASEQVSEFLVSAFDAADSRTRKSLVEPTAKDVLDASAARVSTQLADAPRLRARMQMVLARAYLSIGQPEKGAALLEASVAGFMSKQVNRPDQASQAVSLLVSSQVDSENRDRAVELARQNLKFRLATDAPLKDIENAYSTLGAALMGVSRFDEAGRLLKTAHALIAKIYGNPSMELAWSLNNRAELASNAGEIFEAERLFRESFAMKVRVKDAPGSLYATRGLLAVALRRQGRFDEAEQKFMQNLALAPTLYPEDSVRIVALEQRLGTLYRDKGDFVRAQGLFEKAIATATKTSGERSVKTAMMMTHQGEMQEMRGDLQAAEMTYRSAIEQFDELAEISSASSLRAHALHGLLLERQGRQGADREHLETTFARWIALYGPSGPNTPADVAEARLLQAEHWLVADRPGLVEPVLAPLHLDQPVHRARRQYLIARALQLRGDRHRAIAQIEQAIKQVESVTGSGSAQAAIWRLDYADMLLAERRLDHARTQLALATPTLQKQLVPGAPLLRRMENLRRAIVAAAGER